MLSKRETEIQGARAIISVDGNNIEYEIRHADLETVKNAIQDQLNKFPYEGFFTTFKEPIQVGGEWVATGTRSSMA